MLDTNSETRFCDGPDSSLPGNWLNHSRSISYLYNQPFDKQSEIAIMDIKNEFNLRDVCRNKLIGHWKYIKDNLAPIGIIDQLMSVELIDYNCWEKMKVEPRARQVDILLTHIVRQIHQTTDYQKLSNVLMQENEFIAEHLETPYRGPIVLNKVSDADIRRHEQLLECNRELLENELSPKEIVDDFLERFVITLNDHEDICIYYNRQGRMAKFLVTLICADRCLANGSYLCLLESLEVQNNNTNRVLIAELTTNIGTPARELESIHVSVRPKSMTMYPNNTRTIEVGKLTLTVETGLNKRDIETQVFATIQTEEPIKFIRAKFAMKPTSIKRSSVVVYLESVAGDVKVKIENSVLSGNITEFILKLFKDEALRRSLSPGHYHVKVKIESTDKLTDTNAFNIIKANRQLFIDEFDPLPMIKDFNTGGGKLKSVRHAESQKALVFRKKFYKSGIEQIPDRRERVRKFLEIIEEDLDFDTCYEHLEVYGNTYLIHTLRNDREPLTTYSSRVTVCEQITQSGLVFEGEYDIDVKNDDSDDSTFSTASIQPTMQFEDLTEEIAHQLAAPAQSSVMFEEDLFKDARNWHHVREETLPELRRVVKELDDVAIYIRRFRWGRNATLFLGLVLGAVVSPVTGGSSLGWTIAGAVTFGAGVTVITIVTEKLLTGNVVNEAQKKINIDKRETKHFQQRVYLYRLHGRTEKVRNFATDLHQDFPDAIIAIFLIFRSLFDFIISFISTDAGSVFRARTEIEQLIVTLQEELEWVDYKTKQHERTRRTV